MTSASETGTFKHRALPNASTYIRLLEITSVDQTRDVPIHCQLTTWPKASAPAYTAISYTWGDPKALTIILVNNKRMRVRQNCEDVLTQQCWAKGGYFWIDAICINQADNDEKSFQVARMGEVYRDARQTLACVGRHADDSDFLFDIVHEHRHWYWMTGGDLSNTSSFRDYMKRVLRDKATRYRLERAFGKFYRRSYFGRVWIYQELFYGNDIHLCCADGIVDLSSFWALFLNHRPSRQHPGHARVSPRPDLGLFSRGLDLHYNFHKYEKGGSILLGLLAMEKKPIEFSTMMCFLGELHCEDPRDRVFGTLAIIDWGGETPIRPDYHMDPFDLAVEVLLRLKGTSEHRLNAVLEQTADVASALGLQMKPSRRLADEIRARQSSAHMATRAWAERMGKVPDSDLIIFYGHRIDFRDARWRLSPDPWEDSVEKGLRATPGFSINILKYTDAPTFQKWSKGVAWDSTEIVILLPEDTLPQDWFLLPDVPSLPDPEPRAALVARDGYDGRIQIVGKALILAGDKLRWEVIKRKGSKFGVHLESEDKIVLAHNCNWTSWGDWFWTNINMSEGVYQVDDYFETRLCGEKSLSYATRMEF